MALTLVMQQVDSESFESWGVQAGLEPSQFANALRAMQTKGVLSLERSPTLQLHVPAAVRKVAFPSNEDERAVAVVQSRELSLRKLRAMEEYMTHRVAKGCDENEELWRKITCYFGEEESPRV